MPNPPGLFLSYARIDDEDGRLTELLAKLRREVRQQTGADFAVFQDRQSIQWGQAWRSRIKEGLDRSTFMLAVLTPSFFASDFCARRSRASWRTSGAWAATTCCCRSNYIGHAPIMSRRIADLGTQIRDPIVDYTGRGDFITIGNAIEKAAPGDRIFVRQGIYHEALTMTRPLEIVGAGDGDETVIEARDADVVLFAASWGRLANLTLRQMGSDSVVYGIDITQGRLDLENCDITCRSGAASRSTARPTRTSAGTASTTASRAAFTCMRRAGAPSRTTSFRTTSAAVLHRRQFRAGARTGAGRLIGSRPVSR